MLKYIVYASVSYAQDKSYQKAFEKGCSGISKDEQGDYVISSGGTSQWWSIIPLAQGKGALVITPDEWDLPTPEDGEPAPVDELSPWQRNNLQTKEDLVESNLWVEEDPLTS
jgi:hypothetical protein